MNIKRICILLSYCLIIFLSFSKTQADTTTVITGDTNAYNGLQTQVPVYIDNIDQNIEGFNLIFTLAPDNRGYFTTDHFELSIDTVCSDTIRPCPPEKIIRIDTTISRIVKMDKSGSLTNNFQLLSAHGEVGDTNSPYCVVLNVLGLAQNNHPLGPGFGLLFKLYLDLLCLPIYSLPDTLFYINVSGTLAQADTLIREKKFLSGRVFIFYNGKCMSNDTLNFFAYSPVDLIVTAPNGDSIGVNFNTIPFATYDTTMDENHDGDKDDIVKIPSPIIGQYAIRVVAESAGTGNYTLAVKLDGNEDRVMIANAPCPGPGEVDTVVYTVPEYLHGDANRDGKKNVSDVIYLINYLFKGGPAPDPVNLGDVNFCKENPPVQPGQPTVADVIYLVNYLFKGGKPPCS